MLGDDAKQWVDKLVKLRDYHAAYSYHIDPFDGPHKGKDHQARITLRIARGIVESLAGWAIDHQVGLAKADLKPIGFAPPGVRVSSEYQAEITAVDNHRHEIAGRNVDFGEVDPAFARAAAINLLRANPGAFPYKIATMLADALEALEYGEVQPILKHIANSKKVGLREARLQLRALAFVRYRSARHRLKVQDALQDVADAIGVAPATLRTWEMRLPATLGATRVQATIEDARRAGEEVAAEARTGLLDEPLSKGKVWDSLYDDAALGKLAEQFKAARRGE